MKTEKQKKLEELGRALIKVDRDADTGRLARNYVNGEVAKITKEGSSFNIGPNEILTNALANQTAYEKQLEEIHNVPYVKK